VLREVLALLVLLAQLDRAVCRARREALALLVLLAQLDRVVRRVLREVLALLVLLAQLDRAVCRARREALALLVLLAQLDRAADQQEPLDQQAQRELLRQRALTDKFNTTMAALQWVALRDFTTTTLQIKLA
jgi:hypothetical protein